MRKQERKKRKIILDTIIRHIENNKKQYLIVGILFLIGLIIGVSFFNNLDIDSRQNMNNYITNFIEQLRGNYEIDKINLLKDSAINYLIIALIIWFMGSTVIGIPIVYLIITIKGFSLGYTISCVINALGTTKGTLFSITSLFAQNIIIIPCIFALAISGIKLYKSIMKDKRKENIKLEIARHTIFSLFITLLLIIASFIEVYISSNLLSLSIKFL